MLNVPFAIAMPPPDRGGYVGEDVENILLKLIQAADYDVKRAETGIIYIDEIDKIARKSENPSSPVTSRARASSRRCSRSWRAPPLGPAPGGRKHPHQEFIQIDTTNVLFICGGAFAGLDKVIENRIGKKSIGFRLRCAAPSAMTTRSCATSSPRTSSSSVSSPSSSGACRS